MNDPELIELRNKFLLGIVIAVIFCTPLFIFMNKSLWGENMLNSIIKVDLHIHSKASSYKDGIIVEKSNIDNIDVLVDKID